MAVLALAEAGEPLVSVPFEYDQPQRRHGYEPGTLPLGRRERRKLPLAERLRLGRVEHLGHRPLEPREVAAERGPRHPRAPHELGQAAAQLVERVAARGVRAHVPAHEPLPGGLAEEVREARVVGLERLQHPRQVHVVVNAHALGRVQAGGRQHHVARAAGADEPRRLPRAKRPRHGAGRLDHSLQPALQAAERQLRRHRFRWRQGPRGRRAPCAPP